MTDTVASAIISGISGLVGVVTGSVVTLVVEMRKDNRALRREKQKQVLADLEKIQSDADAVLYLFEAIDNFIKTDFDELDSDYEKVEAIARLSSLNLPSTQSR